MIRKSIRTFILMIYVVCIGFFQFDIIHSEEPIQYTLSISTGGVDGAVLHPGVFEGFETVVLGDTMYIKGVNYNEEIDITGAVTTAEGYIYDVKGYFRCDNALNENVSLMKVTSDTDIMASYSVSRDLVEYTVRYIDVNGKELLPEDQYVGKPNTAPIAPWVFIEGYTPNEKSLKRPLTRTKEDNVYTYVYVEDIVDDESIVTPGGSDTIDDGRKPGSFEIIKDSKGFRGLLFISSTSVLMICGAAAFAIYMLKQSSKAESE